MIECKICKSPAVNKSHCEPCRLKHNARQLELLKANGGERMKALNAKHAAWKKANPEKNRAQWARAYARRKDVLGYARTKKWREKNPEKRLEQARVGNALRDARLRASGRLLRADWEAIKLRQDGKCFDCGLVKKLSIGHLRPVCLGGTNEVSNIVAQCMPCNRVQGGNIHKSLLIQGL